MAESEDATEEDGNGPPDREGSKVHPLERTAPVYVEATDGYVDIRQPQGDPTLYTPEEARDIARDILSAADATERGTGERTDPHGGRG
jgi:hypothetical protein